MNLKDYLLLIEEISSIDLEANSIADSRRILAELNERERILNELRKSIKSDIKHVERDFLEKRRKINQDYANGRSPGIVSRVRGKSKVKELKKLEVEHVTTVQSYQEVKYMIDDLLLQVMDAKKPLNNYIKTRLGGF
jgi:hypothetical protein